MDIAADQRYLPLAVGNLCKRNKRSQWRPVYTHTCVHQHIKDLFSFIGIHTTQHQDDATNNSALHTPTPTVDGKCMLSPRIKHTHPISYNGHVYALHPVLASTHQHSTRWCHWQRSHSRWWEHAFPFRSKHKAYAFDIWQRTHLCLASEQLCWLLTSRGCHQTQR